MYCFYHTDNTLEYICLDCNKIPICSECSILGELHSGHKYVKVNEFYIIDMKEDQKNNFNLILEKVLKSNLVIKEICENNFIQIENRKNENLKLIRDQFKVIHQFVQIVELTLEKQVTINQEKNKNFKLKLLSDIANENTRIESILSNNDIDFSTTVTDYNIQI